MAGVTVTLALESVTVTITNTDALTATDVARLCHDAMVAVGYHPESVAEAFVEVGTPCSAP